MWPLRFSDRGPSSLRGFSSGALRYERLARGDLYGGRLDHDLLLLLLSLLVVLRIEKSFHRKMCLILLSALWCQHRLVFFFLELFVVPLRELSRTRALPRFVLSLLNERRKRHLAALGGLLLEVPDGLDYARVSEASRHLNCNE